MRKHTLTAAAILAAAALLGSTSASAAARDIPALKIGQIGYDAAGFDRFWNRNQERIDISNVSGKEINVAGLLVRDDWSKAQGDDYSGKCNTYKVAQLPGIEETDGKILLPPGHTIRIHSGLGMPRVFDGKIHAVYMNHGAGESRGCGRYGHWLNNAKDTVWIKLNGAEKSKGWDFSRGHYIH